jgi:hypothetical protein
MSIRNLPGGKGRTDFYLQADYLENVEASTSHNPMGLHGLLEGCLYISYQSSSKNSTWLRLYSSNIYCRWLQLYRRFFNSMTYTKTFIVTLFRVCRNKFDEWYNLLYHIINTRFCYSRKQSWPLEIHCFIYLSHHIPDIHFECGWYFFL